MILDNPLPEISGIALLTNLGIIQVVGEDAATFLQGQLTQDVMSLELAQARLAAFCNAKGRMQASFVVFKRGGNEFLLVCSRDILAATLKRLSMFVMRAKAKLSDASRDFAFYGLAGTAIKLIAANLLPTSGKADSSDARMVFLLSGAGLPCALWWAPAGSHAPQAAALDPALWHWLEVRSGIAMITQPIVEAFVPQMLNYESVGGVSFKKGCYPGQEIVARSQFRGTLKRRAYLLHSDMAPAVGQEVFESGDDADQPCGIVAAAAVNPAGGFDAIVSMRISAAAAAQRAGEAGAEYLRLGSATGAGLSLLSLPYSLLEDI